MEDGITNTEETTPDTTAATETTATETKVETTDETPALETKDAPAEGDKGAETTDGDEDPEPDGADPAAWRSWRERESNRIAITRQMAEDAAALRTTVPDDASTGSETTATPSTTAAETGDKPPLVARYEALLSEIENDQKTHDWGDGVAEKGYVPTPGEAKLTRFVGEVLPEIAQAQSEVADMRRFFEVQQSRTLIAAAGEAAATFKSVYGVAITPVALMGMAQNGGAKAWAAINGVPEDDAVFYLTPDAFLSIAETKLGPKLRKARTEAPVEKPVTKVALPPVGRGGGASAGKDGPMTEDDIIDRAHAEARARKGGG